MCLYVCPPQASKRTQTLGLCAWIHCTRLYLRGGVIVFTPPLPRSHRQAGGPHGSIKRPVALTRYEVARCDGNVNLHQRRISPVDTKRTATHRRCLALITVAILHRGVALCTHIDTFTPHKRSMYESIYVQRVL